MKKIIYPTTINFNPGDEIIYMGVRNCVEKIIGITTPIYWNRHPSISPGNQGFDNSFSPSRDKDFLPSYMVFSGSPSWYGSGVWDLNQWLLDTGTRCSFVGIGTSELNPKVDKSAKRVMNELADVILCRDAHTADIISKFVDDKSKIHVLPCPSIMSSKSPFERTSKKIIGLNYQGNDMKWQETGVNLDDCFKELVAELRNKNYDVRIFAHFMQDLVEAEKVFGRSEPIYFSSKPTDLQDWFEEVDVMVGPRLHGCLGCMATGGVGLLSHTDISVRRQGALDVMKVLLGSSSFAGDILKVISDIDVATESKKIITYREEVFHMYKEILLNLDEWISTSEKVQKHPTSTPKDISNLIHKIQRVPYGVYRKF